MLAGVRVLDLSRVIAGPYCSTLMADLGADVVKVERPGPGDDLRAWKGQGMSAVYAAINRNKRCIAVDLQTPDGARLVFELARRADVVVENFLPGVAERLGLGYGAVSAANPSVVYVSVTGFGATNAALVHRKTTGRGQHLDVNLLASMLGLLPDPAAHFFESGKRPQRVGNRNLHLTPAEAFRTQDGFLQVVIMNPDQYARFCGVLGSEPLATDPRFATNDDRLLHHAEMKSL